MSLVLTDQDVKFIVNRQGKRCAVQLSYKKFKDMQKELERLAFFESPQVQEEIAKSDEDLKKGRVIRVSGRNVDQAIAWLNDKD